MSRPCFTQRFLVHLDIGPVLWLEVRQLQRQLSLVPGIRLGVYGGDVLFGLVTQDPPPVLGQPDDAGALIEDPALSLAQKELLLDHETEDRHLVRVLLQ